MANELEIERQKSGLDSEEVRQFVAQERSSFYSRIREILDRYPDLASPSDLDYLHMDRKDKYEVQVKRFATLMTIIKAGEVDPRTDPQLFYVLLMTIRMPMIGLHWSMVIPALQKLMSDAQWKEWEPLCLSFKVIFAYAQTEIGHGTWLSKLETTAEFDPETDEFVINSNGTTGYKYWPGYLGKGCTHALTMAQLIIKGQNLGPHLFVVPIRCRKTYKALLGVDEGDIGPVYSFYERDNGYVGFKDVRIPRRYMLMRYQSVDAKGNYHSEANPKLMFAAMLKIRSELVPFAAVLTTIGATIATRYSIVRRQCALIPGQGESKVIDYVTQQDKLFPAICSSFALQICYHHLQKEFLSVESSMAQGDFDKVTHLHYLLAGLKAFASHECSKHLTILRRACGGHGFSLSSNLPPLMSEADAMCTYEGDNTVMHQQCARNLVRCFLKKSMGKTQSGFVEYLDKADTTCSAQKAEDLMNAKVLLEAYEQRARYVLETACGDLQTQVQQNGLSKEEAWINCGIQLVNSSIAHSHLFIVSHFVAALNQAHFSPLFSKTLEKLCVLYCLLGVRENLSEFLLSRFLKKNQVGIVFEAILTLYRDLRPHMLKLAEGFAFPEIMINSTIGASDGNAYERLLNWSRKSILNDEKFKSEMFHRYLKSVLQPSSKL